MPTDWKTLTPLLEADRATGMTLDALAAKYSVNKGSISRALKPETATPLQPDAATQPATLVAESLQGQNGDVQSVEVTSTSPPSKPLHIEAAEQSFLGASELDTDRALARRLMREALKGERAPLRPDQQAFIKLLLKDELEPEVERNLYAGRPTAELCERAVVLAASVLGLPRLAALIRELGKAGTLDLGLDWTPPADGVQESEATPPVHSSQEAAESVAAPAEAPREAPKAKDTQVETID